MLAAISLACGGGDDGSTSGGAPDAVSSDSAAAPRGAYPTGPYGKTEGALLEPLNFGSGEGAFDLASVQADSSNRLLIISTAAGWCVACIEEQASLEALFQEHGSKGLHVLVAVFEDSNFAPADAAEADRWRRRFSLSFDVVADPAFVLGTYYDRELTPLNMVVDMESMEILSMNLGWDPELIEALIAARL